MAKKTLAFLKEMQQLPLERKILISQARIIEWFNHWDGRVYVSFSGGKDSTVLLHLVRGVFPEVPAVFCNTGLEYPEIVEFVKKTPNCEIIRPAKSFKQVIKEHGFLFPSKNYASFIDGLRRQVPWAIRYLNGGGGLGMWKPKALEPWLPLLDAPFKVSDNCCDEMKKKPLHAYQKKTGRHRYTGLLASEGTRRAQAWLFYGCNNMSKEGASNPLSFWTEADIVEYIQRFRVPYCSIYGDIVDGKFTGEDRTGCIFCLAGVHLQKQCRLKHLKETRPKLWDYCMRPEAEGGLGMREVLEWINANLKVGNMPIDYGEND